MTEEQRALASECGAVISAEYRENVTYDDVDEITVYTFYRDESLAAYTTAVEAKQRELLAPNSDLIDAAEAVYALCYDTWGAVNGATIDAELMLDYLRSLK